MYANQVLMSNAILRSTNRNKKATWNRHKKETSTQQNNVRCIQNCPICYVFFFSLRYRALEFGQNFFFLFLCALFFHFFLVFHSKYSRRERKIGFVYIINTVCTLAQIERYNNMKKKIRVSLYAYFPSLPI